MKEFQLINVDTVESAVRTMNEFQGKAVFMAGGTDLLGGLKREIHPHYPEAVINLSRLEGLEYIREDDGFLKIGALTRLKDIAKDSLVNEKYTALAQAASRTASPTLRQMGTIGGNICQENRCWYYRARENYFPCRMKGGKVCFAPKGDHRNHSIFGALGGCFAVNPSDTAPALVAFKAEIITTQRTIAADDFFTAVTENCTVLEKGEVVLEIKLPQAQTQSIFAKHALRPTIDFPIVNCAVVKSMSGVSICLNAVAPTPHRAVAAEEVVGDKPITAEMAAEAAEAALTKAKALSQNKHKVQIAQTMLKRALLAVS